MRQRNQKPIFHGDGTRHCAMCGDYVDPKDWCPKCRERKAPCREPHRSLTKRKDAAYCDSYCRSLSNNGARKLRRENGR